MAETPHLKLPLMAASQAQKHVTHNEALMLIDSLMQLAVRSKSLTVPPASPAEGDRYIPASSASGVWAGADWNIMTFQDGQWVKLVPQPGFLAWIEDEAKLVVKSASDWLTVFGGTGGVLATSPFGAQMEFAIREELLSGLSGASRVSSIVIPNGAIVFNVSARVVTAVTGPASFSVGISGETGKFGSGLSLASGSTNRGTIGPTGFYADTPIRLTPTGGNFTGGAVRIAIHYYLPKPPQA